MKNLPIIILGGGISGLAAAEKLCKSHKVIVLEGTDQLGGLAASVNYKKKWVPLTYHHLTGEDKLTLKWLGRYGLSKNLDWKSTSMSFWYDFKPYKLSSPQHILSFSPLKPLSRLKLFKLGAYCWLKGRWSNLQGVSSQEWLMGVIGAEALESLFKPLAKIKFGDIASIDAAWLGSTLHEAARAGDKYTPLPCKALIDSLANKILSNGGSIYMQTMILKVKGNVVTARIGSRNISFKAKKIISSIPPPELARVADVSPAVKSKLNKIKYISIISSVVSSKEQFLKSYWNIFIKPKLSFGGIFNHSAIAPNFIPGENLYYLFTYLKSDEPLFKKTDGDIKRIYLKDISRINPAIKASFISLRKIRYASPIFSRGYTNLPIKISEHIYLTGVYKEHPATRTVAAAIRSGIKTADFIINEKTVN